jgi:hypothetical protein
MRRKTVLAILGGVFLLAPVSWTLQQGGPAERVEAVAPDEFIALLIQEPDARQPTEQKIARTWQPGYAVMALEILYFSRDPALSGFLVSTLEEKTGQRFGRDIRRWYEWLWSRPAQDHPRYPEFKSHLYRLIDPKFGAYFGLDRPTEIRLDEVRWGGVRQDGIPPLRSPKMISAAAADYLEDDNVVFGLEVNGDARAYPKRILAWHELFTDTIGGVPVAGVYCTLCGTVILYETELDGVRYDLGTSGFLYRSNKLMYDRATQSLWNTIWGRPAIGPLARESIQLARRSVVTTTWGEWRRRHPTTRVLSLDTGYQRDYSEGAAYREYFSTDDLMFNVPKVDRRLKNKDEVLTLVLAEEAGRQLAISADFLAKSNVYHDRIGSIEFVVLTDRSGANRVYRTAGERFVGWDLDRAVTDTNGQTWILSEDRLVAADGRQLERLPAQRAFWFGWFAAFPDTRLVM